MLTSLLCLASLCVAPQGPPELSLPIPVYSTREPSSVMLSAGYLHGGRPGYHVGAGWISPDGSALSLAWHRADTAELEVCSQQTVAEAEFWRVRTHLGACCQVGAAEGPLRVGPLLALQGEVYLGRGLSVAVEGGAAVFLAAFSGGGPLGLRPVFQVQPRLVLRLHWYAAEGVQVTVGYDLGRRRFVASGMLTF